jgi:hypothetical protein
MSNVLFYLAEVIEQTNLPRENWMYLFCFEYCEMSFVLALMCCGRIRLAKRMVSF